MIGTIKQQNQLRAFGCGGQLRREAVCVSLLQATKAKDQLIGGGLFIWGQNLCPQLRKR